MRFGVSLIKRLSGEDLLSEKKFSENSALRALPSLTGGKGEKVLQEGRDDLQLKGSDNLGTERRGV